MERIDLLAQINKIFHDVLDDDTIDIIETTSANDVEEWDSLNHIMLIVAIEKYFKIKFSSNEILSWKNVGEMISCIIEKK